VAEILRDRAATGETQPEVLAHHFTQAGMTDAAVEWWGQAGDQALRRSAFQEAISHLGKAIDMVERVDEGAPRQATKSVSDQLRLQTDYGRALAWSRGFAAEKTKAAYARAQELSAGSNTSDERFAALYGQWVVSFVRGELGKAREIAGIFQREAENATRMTEVAVGFRYLGLTCLFQGELDQAETYLVQALNVYDRERDREFNLRYGVDTGAAALIYLACVKWYLGGIAPVGELIEEAVARAHETGHVPTLAGMYQFKIWLETLRGDAVTTRQTAEAILELGHRHKLAAYVALGEVFSGWARAKLGEREPGIAELQRGLVGLTELGNKTGVPYPQGLLAEIEADGQQVEAALARIDGALALAMETGERWTDALLHRIRGEILLKHEPTNTAPAEEAFLTAIAIAQQQKARSFELAAAVALAKLYQSDNRLSDAHAVLAAALEGFVPTPELPQIEGAQALLTALAEADEVKRAAAARERRLKLQTAYGLAVAWSRGFAADETKAAFARVHELSTGADSSDDRFTGLYGQWVASLQRAELDLARQTAETFLREAVKVARMPETVAALRYLGLTCLCQGHFVEARAHLEEVLRIYDPGRDRDASFRFGTDSLASATIYLARVCSQLGEFVRARKLSDQAIAWAVETGHAATIANTWAFKAGFEMNRGDAEATLRAALALAEPSQRQKLSNYQTQVGAFSGWARARLGARETGIAELRQALTAYIGQGNKLGVPGYQGRLAEIEAGMGDAEAALIRIDQALALANETGQHQYIALLHRIRGEILLKLGPAKAKSAEDSFLSSVAIAHKQGAQTEAIRYPHRRDVE
jgi:predicted ATPase